jgi:hypothetical protein
VFTDQSRLASARSLQMRANSGLWRELQNGAAPVVAGSGCVSVRDQGPGLTARLPRSN